MGVGEPDKMADELICDVLNNECRKQKIGIMLIMESKNFKKQFVDI